MVKLSGWSELDRMEKVDDEIEKRTEEDGGGEVEMLLKWYHYLENTSK